MFRTMTLGLLFSAVLLLTGIAFAQPAADPFGPAPDAPPPDATVPNIGAPDSAEIDRHRHGSPTLRLTYYAGREGYGWKEIAYFDLDEWTPEKDIIVTAKWIQPSGARSPIARGKSTFNRRTAYRRAWSVEYVDAVTEGESHLFIDAPGLPRISERIRSERDTISFLHFPTSGWHELGAAARAMRDFQNDAAPPTQNPASPSDTRSR